MMTCQQMEYNLSRLSRLNWCQLSRLRNLPPASGTKFCTCYCLLLLVVETAIHLITCVCQQVGLEYDFLSKFSPCRDVFWFHIEEHPLWSFCWLWHEFQDFWIDILLNSVKKSVFFFQCKLQNQFIGVWYLYFQPKVKAQAPRKIIHIVNFAGFLSSKPTPLLLFQDHPLGVHHIYAQSNYLHHEKRPWKTDFGARQETNPAQYR